MISVTIQEDGKTICTLNSDEYGSQFLSPDGIGLDTAKDPDVARANRPAYQSKTHEVLDFVKGELVWHLEESLW